MFKKVLIANRGEIAVRVIRACRELGIRTVAVYSKIDEDAIHTQLADEAVCIGSARAKDSYLNVKNILSAAVLTGSEAIHPGFGFLSENSKFAGMCRECNIKFIGPDPETIELMGNKSKAKNTIEKAGVAVIKGSKGAVKSPEEGLNIAKNIGFPVMIKASAGGGGKGIRIVKEENKFLKEFSTASTEARAAFGDDSMYIEKFIENPRHVEIQILGDNYGNIIYLGERDCSVQRRNQKILEEAPCTAITEEIRKRMGEAAVNGAKVVGYKNAGTIEFLLDNKGEFYFMEMNTRIQVEHPITEMITGVDLVKEQIKIASGENLSIRQEDIVIKGHAIECRINAEDPERGFMPSPGKVNIIHLPGGMGVRLDSAIYQGYKIPPNYDSMIGKLIVHADNREEAIKKMKRALGEFIIEGVKSNIEFHHKILNNSNFEKSNIDTSFINKEFGI
ncbi:acetyl-CoA carboxylase biotin carboxylase subunit [Hathewaya histolytica]|uniref:acetyl-CoA carboxylase biotin carboxylase subunit n=1 Tax=Hathewaya histolytica TaxID=1498 RepID=UPI003B6772BD